MMIDNVWNVPQTEESRLFCLAEEKWKLSERGYLEEEYFFSGSASIYRRNGNKKKIILHDAPYINRMIIRMPKKREDANGIVFVEILNPTAFIDQDRCFLLIGETLIFDGAAYVGITSKPCVLRALRRYDPVRYRALQWNNPRVCHEPTEILGNIPGASSPETEDGLFWDMLWDVSHLLGSGSLKDPLRCYPCRVKILGGWSQSGAYLARYLQDFAVEDNCFDGYFSCGSVARVIPRLNQSDFLTEKDASILPLEVSGKMIEVHTESENQKMGNHAVRSPDSDNYRVYDIAGASHDTQAVSDAYYRCDPWIWKCGIIPNYRGREPFANDFPCELAFSAAFDKLCRWIVYDEVPEHIDPIAFDSKLENIRDDSGNVIGGWRLPHLEVPTATYYDWSTPLKQEFALGCSLFGHRVIYGAEKLNRRYGSMDNYLALVEQKAEMCIAKKLLLREQKDMCLKQAKKSALEAWI